MLGYFSDSGGMGLCIIAFALVLYWQLIDLLCLKTTSSQQARLKLLNVQQLLKWVSAAPLLGLLGTVSGLTDSFIALNNNPGSSLSSGIAKALLTTEMGLTIAIPAWVALLFQQRRLQLACIEIESLSYAETFIKEGVCVDGA